MKFILLLLFLCVNAKAEIFEMVRLSHDYKIVGPESMKQKLIEKPYGLWLDLIEFYGKRNYCLKYKTPFKKNLGELKLLLKKGGVCQEQNVMWYQGDVQKLRINTVKSTITISYELQAKTIRHEIYLINRLLDDSFKLLDPAVKKKILPGVHLIE